ncbi:MAG: hypothetical protein KGL39_55375 [Patescibacteria group bacterium]|nr:hypothetical protein [Patescibacteria group bacterium]
MPDATTVKLGATASHASATSPTNLDLVFRANEDTVVFVALSYDEAARLHAQMQLQLLKMRTRALHPPYWHTSEKEA